MPTMVIIGAGVGGLSSALTLSRRGHDVTLVERDATPLPQSADAAFDWDRSGAPQVRHSHAFLARLRNLLRDHYPDVLQALIAAGATDMDFIEMLPEGMDRTRLPGDEDLVALAVRRTTFEWVLRRVVLAEPGVRLLDGRSVRSVIGSTDAPIPTVNGVALDDGTELAADLVVLAGGRRCSPGPLLAPLLTPSGIEIAERSEDTGIVYLSRFFRLRDDADWPQRSGPIGGDLGYLKYAVFQGDNRTFSITFAVATDDAEFRTALVDPTRFLDVAAQLPATAPYVDGRAEPITEVFVMAGLLNRRRYFTDTDGTPLIAGLSAVGDAHTCTNPLYGRGCSLALVQAQLLADSLDAASGDRTEQARWYEAACEREIIPWYRAAVAQDRSNREGDPVGVSDNPIRAVLRDGLLPAMRTDPVVLRAFLRMFNLLDAPDSLLTNWDVVGRVMTVYQERDQRPAEAPLGPDRQEMWAAIA